MRTSLVIMALVIAVASSGCKDAGDNADPASPVSEPTVRVGADTTIVEGRVGYFSAVTYPGNPAFMPAGYTLGEISWIANPPRWVSSIVFLDGKVDASYKRKYVHIVGAIDSLESSFGYYLQVHVYEIQSIP